MSAFIVGEIVELKSSRLQMVIKSIDGSEAACLWFTGDKRNEASFPLATVLP
jgi:uncharacterized protein YodC (DUF2158 family)